ncbi:MAG TPA: sigma-70 family RNA polymerase sigma factor [Dehalococcoidia bacterium]|nr:sigma-70 family RNA polymerase sigma factor [Dehalococcoidia bacterium]
MARQRADASELALQLLVLRCQTGDERAFERLLEQFGDRTHRYLRGLVGDAADDVQQEVWLSVYRGIASLAAPHAFRTWLFRTTRHRALDYLRSCKREEELLVDADVDSVQDVVHALDVEPAVTALAWERLDQLSPAHREVLLLRYRDDMSYEQIALVTGCTVGTVRSRLHYAKQRLLDAIDRRDT